MAHATKGAGGQSHGLGENGIVRAGHDEAGASATASNLHQPIDNGSSDFVDTGYPAGPVPRNEVLGVLRDLAAT
ncbi:MAG: hypothetical protein OXQ29_07860 [Rhodospirillaceae bacterium]|nr:hypothetical protein [Rhodospirillaceae bacterium]